MSSYGRHFGFMRSDETLRHAEGRYRTPKGAALPQGTLVTIDHATQTLRKAAPADIALPASQVGILSQESDFIPLMGQTPLLDTDDRGDCRPDTLSEMSYGAGTKVFYRNVPARDAGYKQFAARTPVDAAGLAAGDQVTVDAAGLIVKAGAGAASFGTVTAVLGDRVEIVLSK